MVLALIAQTTEPLFPDQVTTDSLVQNIVYAVGTVGAILLLAGLILVDVGGVRRVNVFESAVQKLVGFFIGFAVYFLIGFAIWNWQYYVAFEVPSPYWQSIQDWWLGGTLANELAHQADPAVAPGLNNQQIFIFFLACFAGIINVLIHLAVTERIKAAAFYVISAVAAVVSSLLSWLLWGSTGPITNLGYHDFFGVGFVYLFAGAMGVVLARRMGPRPGMYRPTAGTEFRPYNLGLTVVGVLLIFAGLPMVILSCGFFFAPEAFYVSVTMAETSVGIAYNNFAVAWAGGALTGALIAYWKKKYIYTLLGPLAGYLSGAVAFDIYKPWQMFLVALGAPVVAYFVYEAGQRRELDEHKLLPLFIGAGTYGAIVVGFVKWGTPHGGFLGLEEGTYAFQSAEVTPWWQILGVLIALGTGVVVATLLAVILERTIGLREPDEVLIEGFDLHYWGTVHDIEPTVTDGRPVAVGVVPADPLARPAPPAEPV